MDTKRFVSVPAAARLLGVSAATLYRCIAADEFPAVRIRTRVVVPIEAVERMRELALREHRSWTQPNAWNQVRHDTAASRTSRAELDDRVHWHTRHS